MSICQSTYIYVYIQLIEDRVAKNPEIISKKFQFSTWRTRILMGFITSTMLCITWY